ncbi:hypothetical protein SAMN05444007_101476 [Cribrihabitans marinus]|uniref:Uncharacterized protein n=1 Tax=Cribrihabitans marinus TaxID=1227549 RepID=A0A1H6RQ62_9RHOB|nr:hypothetical protein [Cribrihabitans marinus]GGH20905.1 hypothetical protein GCM10010973_05180 [Cribrihabitans marinus]SEI53342.1 hypothetical protein SAMN05444007_101476 [Cribrihabitans marinus]
MSKLHLLGFAAVCAITGAGVDYYLQNKKAGGSLGLSGYIQNVNTRFDLYQAEKHSAQLEKERQQRWREGGKPYLPEAPAGWSRRSLLDGENAAVLTVRSRFEAMNSPSAAASPVAMGLSRAKAEDMARKADKRGWVYENGEQIVWIDVHLKPRAARNSLMGLVSQTIAAENFGGRDQAGFAVIGGVGFIEDLGHALASDADKRPYREIIGRIGLDEEVVIRIHAQADDAAIRDILAGVDFEGLNALLRWPVPVVGNDVVVPEEAQPDLALAMGALHSEFRQLQAAAAQQQISNIDEKALVVNTITSGNGGRDGVMDLTGGKVADLGDRIQRDYRKGLKTLVDGDRRKAGIPGLGAAKGFLATIGSAFGKGDDIAAAEPREPVEVKVRKGGTPAGVKQNCSLNGAVKRCTLSGG